jgi:hypothetical protein
MGRVSADPKKSERRPPAREVRACFTRETIRVYQAFSPEIADRATKAQTFQVPFSRGRMTWIKPSFTWMMYRSGWATKPGQERVLAVDIRRSGFEWALAHSCLSAFAAEHHASFESWQATLRESPVRIQWDPERTWSLAPLEWRTIQVGLSHGAVDAYVDEWITHIADVTELAHETDSMVRAGAADRARQLVPAELPYPLPADIARRIGASAAPIAGDVEAPPQSNG